VTPTGAGGDGRIDASDVTVVRLYALGSLPPVVAMGPGDPTTTRPDDDREVGEANRETAVGRIVRAVNTTAISGQQVTVQFQLDSQGDEASLSFTVGFDPAKLAYVGAVAGTQVPAGTVLNLNASQAAQGRLGVPLDSTNTYAPGTRQVLTVTFAAAAGLTSQSTPITFSSTPTIRRTSNAQGGLLETVYESGSVTFGLMAAGVNVSGRVTSASGQGLRNAVVTMTDAAGNRRSVTTGSFGIYTFEDVESGKNYVLGVASERFRFATRLIPVTDSLANVDFAAME
jgi:hypothetical protein